MYQDLRVIDFHAHFPTNRRWFGRTDRWAQAAAKIGERRAALLREQAKAYNEEWRLAWDFPAPETEKHTDEEQAERWAAEVDRYGLDKVVFVTGGGNDNLARIVKMYPDKFVGFAHHDPFEENAAQELERAVTELGMRGYKLLAPALDRPVDDETAFPVWEVAAKYEIPVLIHFGILGGGGGVAWHPNINPLTLHDVAKAFPDVNFVVPHLGCTYVRETLQLCWACRNVCVDTSGSNQWVRWMPGDLTVKQLLRKYLETIGPDRILFGSDSSWFPRGFAVRYLQDQIRDLRELGVSYEVMQKILAGNASRLLKLN
ncbi:MAG TPA: amidohydrolase, partial [Anaerolineae bacterium]|nr:amidohydrolase [Anaerolineae bacterium]